MMLGSWNVLFSRMSDATALDATRISSAAVRPSFVFAQELADEARIGGFD